MTRARWFARVAALMERFNALGMRERGLVFAAALTLVYFAWQSLLMDPLTARGKAAERRLAEARQRQSAIEQVGEGYSADPLIAAASRNRALDQRVLALDGELQSLSQGYVSPDRMAALLHELLERQHGLALVSLENLPVESLSRPDSGTSANGPTGTTASAGGNGVGSPAAAPSSSPPAVLDPADHGPFLHPVEIIVDGSYGDLVDYLRELEQLPWRIYWKRLELEAGPNPANRVRIVIGALSLSREWLAV